MNGDRSSPPRRRLLLAGSHGVERLPARPDPRTPSWHEPLHVRDAAAARERLAAQVAAGVDVVVAPTWQTHRRALLPVGETRRARAWTAAAVEVAREAVDEGLERRAAGAGAGDEAGSSAGPVDALERPAPLVAASLPALDDDGPELETGRLLPREAAQARDHVDQAGLLADAEPDLLLVEGQATPHDVRLALEAATATGLPTWLALSGIGASHEASDAAPGRGDEAIRALVELTLELAEHGTIDCLLFPRPPSAQEDLRQVVEGLGTSEEDLVLGGLVRSAQPVAAWLELGARAIAMLDGATPPALQPIRRALDDHEHAELEAWRERERRWWAHVRQAAAMTSGGAALWIAAGDPAGRRDADLPDGFEWLVVDDHEVLALPRGRFRLVIDAVGLYGAAARIEPLVEHGGVVALPLAGAGIGPSELRLLSVDDQAEPPLAILRREG